MKKYIDKTEQYITSQCVEQTCNFCGKSASNNDIMFCDITEIEILPGYGSKFDGDEIQIDICDDCLEKLIGSMLIKPTIEEML